MSGLLYHQSYHTNQLLGCKSIFDGSLLRTVPFLFQKVLIPKIIIQNSHCSGHFLFQKVIFPKGVIPNGRYVESPCFHIPNSK